jgi:hypothetical protein
VGNSAALSTGQVSWIELDLAPGTYVATCWIPDRETRMPHMLMEMITIFTVSEA